MQMIRPESPETVKTMTTQQTKPFGAVIIDTRWRTQTYSHTVAILFTQHLVSHLRNFYKYEHIK